MPDIQAIRGERWFSLDTNIEQDFATLPYALEIANKGLEEAVRRNAHLRRGLTTYRGMLTLKETAEKYGIPFVDPLIAIDKV